MAAEVLPVRLAASGGVMVLLGRVELVEQRQPLEQQLGVIGQRVTAEGGDILCQPASAAQAAGAQQPGPDAGANNNQQKPNDDGVVDADFKEV